MKTLNLKTLLLTSLFLSLAPLMALAEGGSSDGGLNTLKHIPVEDYAEDLSNLKGYKVYQEKLKLLREAAPDLVKELEDKMEKSTIYVIPAEIAKLSSEKTGLRFDTEQGGYQNGREIFFNEEGVNARSEEKAGMAIMHEALMRVQEKPEARTVRQVNVKLFAKNATAISVGNALTVNNFGANLGPTQKKIIGSHARQDYYDAVQLYLKDAQESCGKGSSTQGIKSILQYGGYERVAKGRSANITYGQNRAYHNGFFSPFIGDNFMESMIEVRGMGVGVNPGAHNVFQACVLNSEQMGKDICHELMDQARLYESEMHWKFPTFSEENTVRSGAYSNMVNEYENGASRAFREEALFHIVKHPAFVTILAQIADPIALRNAVKSEEAANCDPKRQVCLDHILKPVVYRQSELRENGEMNSRQLL
ncbi:MAG: hypothetical protein ACXVBE_17105, partial [Bdellovibrionota bacterium]